jgi:hypothetical protein
MRRLCRSVTVVALLAALWVGCGSTGSSDSLVFQFIAFDGMGITQADSVRETSADVDTTVDCCAFTADGSACTTIERFTQTSINATFRNNEAADITLNGYTVNLGPNSGVGVFQGELSTALLGGRCVGFDQACASNNDCAQLSTGGVGTTIPCVHSETTVSGILLFDIDTKLHVIPGTYNVAITFFGSDANQSFEAKTSYVVRFDDFNNC